MGLPAATRTSSSPPSATRRRARCRRTRTLSCSSGRRRRCRAGPAGTCGRSRCDPERCLHSPALAAAAAASRAHRGCSTVCLMMCSVPCAARDARTDVSQTLHRFQAVMRDLPADQRAALQADMDRMVQQRVRGPPPRCPFYVICRSPVLSSPHCLVTTLTCVASLLRRPCGRGTFGRRTLRMRTRSCSSL